MTRGIYGVPVTQIVDDLLELTVEELRLVPRTPGVFWPEQHAEICKAAERVTRQQRRYQERQRRKGR